jgi:hypothetical protein
VGYCFKEARIYGSGADGKRIQIDENEIDSMNNVNVVQVDEKAVINALIREPLKTDALENALLEIPSIEAYCTEAVDRIRIRK